MIIRYSPRATRDLESIRQYLAEQTPKSAGNVLSAIYAAIEFIRRNPEAAEATGIPAVRAKVVWRYRFKIFYRVFEIADTIEIIHVRHTSRRPWLNESD